MENVEEGKQRIDWDDLLTMSEQFRVMLNTIEKDEEFYAGLHKLMHQLDHRYELLFILLFAQWDFEEIAGVYPDILDIALDGDVTGIPLARAVICRHCGYPGVKETTASLAGEYSSTKDSWVYRRMAELLTNSYDPDLMGRLMESCGQSDDPDLLEIYDEYHHMATPAD